MTLSKLSVSDAVASRRSIRSFSDRPVELGVIRSVLEKAQMSPSGCNLQPWEATILTGSPLQALVLRMTTSEFQKDPEYPIVPSAMTPVLRARYVGITAARHNAEKIVRDDVPAREAAAARNYTFFGAPVGLLCYLRRDMGGAQWSDMGMWLQTIMLLLREEGIDSCALESLSRHGRLIKDFLGVCDETHIFFCGMAIGYRNPEAPINSFERSRDPLDDAVRFMGFD